MGRATRTTTSRTSRTPRQPPAPPPDGWTLMGAAEALCPREARLYRQGGPALDAAAGVDRNDEWDFGGLPDAWLSKLVLAALAKRPELQITGRDLAGDIRDGRYRLPRDVLLAALSLALQVL